MAHATEKTVIESIEHFMQDASCSGVEEWREGDKLARTHNLLDAARAADLMEDLKEKRERREGSVRLTFIDG